MRPEEFDIVAALQQGLTTQTYNDILAKIITHDHHMREGETRTVELTMVEDYEYFEGHEVIHETWTRNPLVFQGEYINVHQGKDGNHYATLRKLVLIDGFNAVRIGNAITTELKTAQKMLGL